ncbi:hypothetical protein [Allomuricauda sp. F6463D]|uniref:hypothetical protein n=1 Tax=Allomuricauda sp. F6463D TaxID=2926409 RepID=UPI001FF4B9F3|nr:hypothetical protein [Muricauda sp. F6463D]MCK0161179.1 hypothetical protein [Muricauda sp. F6463D]
MSFESVQQRWDGFLDKIEDRFHNTLKKAEEVLPTLLDYQNFETGSFINAWNGISMQAKNLINKIENSWDDKVEQAFENEDDNSEGFSKKIGIERDKLYETQERLENELKSYEVRTYANAAKKLVQKAKEELSKDFLCTQCNAKLNVKDNFFRSYYQICEFCTTTNTFEPGSIARMVEHFALNALGEEAALNEYFQYVKIQKLRTENNATRKDVLKAYRSYIEKFLNKRIEIIPEYEKRYEKDIEAKLEFIQKTTF